MKNTQESDGNGYTREKEEKTIIENKTERYQRDLKSTGLRVGEETDREMWRRKIISHTGDHTLWLKQGKRRLAGIDQFEADTVCLLER